MVALASGPSGRRQSLPLETTDRQTPDLPASSTVVLGLDDTLLTELQRFGLLYDRDEQGDFSHAYTDTFEDRFFFEIVQRRGGYQQFGAVNAAVRMAMQARLREQARIEDLLS